ncbi:MAG: O-antigen ligase family protein [Sulfuricaulis sp.]
MPEFLKTLIVVLVLATTVFAFAHRPACAIMGTRNFTRRRNLWFTLTLAAFLTQNFWIYTVIAIPLLIFANLRETNPSALFLFVLFALPMATISIPGLGLINFFFDLSHARLLELFILLPAFFSLIRQRSTLTFGRTGADKILAIFLLLTTLLYLRETTVTDTLRQAFYLFIDAFLPYFVISRSLKNMQAFRDTLLSLVVAVMVVALVAVFETARHWLLYRPLLTSLGLGGGFFTYVGRGGMLRATATAGHPIALGYLMVVGIGLYLFLLPTTRPRLVRRLGMALLATGLIASLSRGPWVGAAVLLVVFTATGRFAIRRLVGLAIAATFALALIAMLPGGEKVTNMLPFIGTADQGSISYRENLLNHSITVIKRSPWFGSVNYLDTPEMESMRQGEGIIDIVNTYIAIALQIGFVGLGLFASFFILILLGIFRTIRSIQDRHSEEHLLGRALLATLLAILLIIFTVSPITIVPIMYWSVAGLGVAYTQMMRQRAAEKVYGSTQEPRLVKMSRNGIKK